MARPPLADWESVFGFSEDPTPGNPETLEHLATQYRSVSEDALSAQSVVSRLDAGELGEGKSMEKLWTKLGDLPVQVGKLQSSYEVAAQAIDRYADSLRETQQQADRALDQGREAKRALDAAILVASTASARLDSLDKAETPPPDDEEARSSTRRALADAQQAKAEAQRSVESAEADLEAARLLALDARDLRTTDAALAKRELDEASGEAVKGKNFWEKIGDLLNLVFSVVSAVLGVVAMVFTGPIGVVLGAGALIFGAGSVILSIAKGIDTKEWDIYGIVTGIVGLGLGGFAMWAGKGLGALGKVPLGQWFKNLIWWAPGPGAAGIEFDVLNGIGQVIQTITHVPKPAMDVLEALISGSGLVLSIGGIIYSFLDFFGLAGGAKVRAP
ncbi:putative T7SS-secreted protein [Streptomyces sp. NPDC018031]|uniref:putative T7SS-secreted protein n=1 Tax=Streptomyces sp. NPDC018031 TaxID=3365033 RepID=UPI0037BB1FE8